jgi:hypothetical protein
MGASDTLFDGTFSGVAHWINGIRTADEARALGASVDKFLDFAMRIADDYLPGAFKANLLDLTYSAEKAAEDINHARARLAESLAAISEYGGPDILPAGYAAEIRGAITNGWSVSYTIAGIADALPSLGEELAKVSQNLREAPAAFGDVAAGVGDAIDKILAALGSKLWPWLVIAGVVALFIFFGPEIKLIAFGAAKGVAGG